MGPNSAVTEEKLARKCQDPQQCEGHTSRKGWPKTYLPKKSFGLALMYKIHLERQAGHLEASHQYTQNTWAF